MPIYEFRCDGCGERFEELVAVGTETATCPACGAEGARRLMSQPAAPARLVKTPAQNRRLEEKRGISRGGALKRFKAGRDRARKARSRGPGGGDS